jgi:transposase
MPKVSKIINKELVLKAREALNNRGKNGVVVTRLRAIIASSKHGIKKVAEVYDINRSSLHRWAALFRDQGIDGLKNIAKPSRSKLNTTQKDVIKTLIERDSSITIKKLKIVIKEKFDIDIEKSSIHRMLGALGFRHITGRKRHYKADESSKEEFKKKSTTSTPR